MKRLAAILFVVLCAGCQTTVQPNGTPEENSGEFGKRNSAKTDQPKDEPQIVLERAKVAEFRGVEMPKLLERLESGDRDQWVYVRRHVHPAPQPPVTVKDNRVVTRNYDWPPTDNRLSDRQKAWKSYLLWPAHIRGLLEQPGWDAEDNRRRLARLGRIYRTVYKFQTAPAYRFSTQESAHWKQFAEEMLAFGEDGRDLLIANMVLALTSPEQEIVANAQNVLVQVGPPAIEALCAALWTGHNQLVEVTYDDGETAIKVTPNSRFPKYIIDCLMRIGPRSVSQAIYELQHGPTTGSAWRFRKNFVELLGRFKAPAAVKVLEEEVTRVEIKELDGEALARGETVIDESGTDHARFVFREYIMQAIGRIGASEGLRTVIKIWKMDREFHADSAIDAVLKITGRNVRTIEEVRALAIKLNVDLKGE